MRISKLIGSVSAFAAVITISYSLSASAATVDDVANTARSYGYSEADIQAGYNAYYENPSNYPPELLDDVIAYLHEAGNQIISTAPQEVDPTVPITTVSVTPSDGNDDPTQENIGDITLTASDGSVFTRISTEAFINMSYDEKMAYIHSFPPVQQQAIIDNLSPEEYRSILKQSPTDQKMEVIGKIAEAAEKMGLNVTVDEITDNSIKVAMKNEKGELVNVSTAGAVVEDTGYDRRGLIALSASLIAAAAAMTCILLRHIRKNGLEF